MTRTINTPNGLITCTVDGGFLTLAGPTGAHRVMVDERTNVEAHVAGFVEANGGAVLSAPVLIGTTAAGSDWIAYPDRHTLADVATMVGRIGKFGGTPTAEALALLGRTAAPVITFGDIGPMVTEDHDGDYRWGNRRADKLQPVMLNGEHVGSLARCYQGDEGEGMRLACYHWRPVSPDHYLPLDEQDDYVFQYSSARAALAAKKAQIAAALGA